MDLFLERFDNLLKNKKISRNKLAKDLNISESTIRSWYNGSVPALDKVYKISQYFAIPIDFLVGNEIEIYTDEEKQIIEKYRQLDSESQQAFKTLLHVRSNSSGCSGKSSEYKIG